MKGIGLVLAGGGGKGSYQIGVWKYLHETGLDSYIRGISGTSIGALNGALFASGDYTTAEKLWENIQPDQALSPKRISMEDILVRIGRIGLNIAAARVCPVSASKMLSLFPLALSQFIASDAMFSRDGLISLIRNYVDFTGIRDRGYPCFATCVSKTDFRVRRFDLREYSACDASDILLATSAIPVVYDSVTVGGTSYYDGGVPLFGDNIPIQPVYDTGVEYILVIHLKQDKPIDRSLYPDSKIIEIVPSKDLGGPVDGTMDFSSDGARWRMQLGYEDAQKVLGPFVRTISRAWKSQKELEKYAGEQILNTREYATFHQEMLNYRQAKKDDGFDELFQKLVNER